MIRSALTKTFAPEFPAGAGLSPREIASSLSWSRREFLRNTAGLAVGSTLACASPFLRGETARKKA